MEVNNLEILNKTLKAIEISDSENYIKFTLKDGNGKFYKTIILLTIINISGCFIPS